MFCKSKIIIRKLLKRKKIYIYNNSGDLFFQTAWHALALEQRHESWQRSGLCFRDMPFAVSVKIHPNLAKLSGF